VTVVVTLTRAALWTDSRYFLQAENQLKDSGIVLMKEGLPETLSWADWLAEELKNNEKVGINTQMFSYNTLVHLKNELEKKGIFLISVDLIGKIWKNRPTLPSQPFYVYDIRYAGETASNKLASLREQMKKNQADAFVISALDEIAWLFNIRGNDVDFNPVAIAYAMVELDKVTLFVDPKKVTGESAALLREQGITIEPYNDIYLQLKKLSAGKRIWIDGSKLNAALYEAISSHCTVINSMSPVLKMKSVKNKIELEGTRQAMIRDGVALVKFFKWLEENLLSTQISEISAADKLLQFRQQQENFVSESFDTICGYAGHGAIVHYHAEPETNVVLKPENLLLVDSGGQYFDGTTDITRTIALGNPTLQQKIDYTLVLKGHIALAKAKFPTNTRGSQLDILAHKWLWENGLNYGHGTGHGVGHFLCVHEGPQNIRMDENPAVLLPGMIVSDEPGLYRTNAYGIRIENLVLVVEDEKTEFGNFLCFETLTLFPYDHSLIHLSMLTEEEINWINSYQEKVLEKLSPYLNEEEKSWLQKKCISL
jgi:Xaa-Pro aminopeptidase